MRLGNSSLLQKHTGQQMRAGGVINSNYPRGPWRTESAGGSAVGDGVSRGKIDAGQQFRGSAGSDKTAAAE